MAFTPLAVSALSLFGKCVSWMSMHQHHDDETLRMDVGRAEDGRMFVRVVHLPSGANKTQVGLNGETSEVVGRRLAMALMQENESESKRSDK